MTRAELKSQARQILSENYWKIVGMLALMTLILAASPAVPMVGPAAMFFLMPIEIGVFVVITDISDGINAPFEQMFTEAFKGKYYLRRVGGYAWMTLWITLWSLLFVIPGIVKAYSYIMTPYILAKEPDTNVQDALKKSMRIMNGRKAEFFVLHLSFIGWGILSGLTAGILGVFYVLPYFYITQTLYMKQVLANSSEPVQQIQPVAEPTEE